MMGQPTEEDRQGQTAAAQSRRLLFSGDGSVIGFADRQLLGAGEAEPHGEHALWPETIADQENNVSDGDLPHGRDRAIRDGTTGDGTTGDGEK
ncbi:hypothetical protein IV500_00130 [Paeniglutamicibacter antarcticus]|uniref:Uncharacterized protein n=1 Tax=Arthrobacter terrae TaxID=2935737 RepID=A0A931CN43_9MICC|nr:hypothetical protein [Arthrobacter terrae]MBG0737851.1 hypothetical protein [Arthrobacter terrae]